MATYEELLQQLGTPQGRSRPASTSTPGFQTMEVDDVRDVENPSLLDAAFSAEAALNLLPGSPGTRARGAIESVPLVGGALATAADIGFSPVSLATAAFGGPLAAGLGRAGTLGRAAGGLVSPITSRGFLPNLAAEAGIGLASTTAAEEVTERTGNPLLGAGAGLGAGLYSLRAIGNIQGAMNPARRAAQELASDDPAHRLVGLIRQSQNRTRRVVQPERTEEIARRGAEMKSRLAGVTDPIARQRIIANIRKGELPGREQVLDVSSFTPQDVSTLLDRVVKFPSFKFDSYAEGRGLDAMTKLLGGELVQESEAKLLGQIFGADFAGAIRGRKLSDTLLDIANIPRAVVSSLDISAPLRQGALLARRKEWWGNWAPMIRAFGSEKYAQQAMDAITREDPRFLSREAAGLHMTPLFGGLQDREEAFMTSLAEHLPIIGGLVKRSERAFVLFLNKTRADVFDNTLDRWSRLGKKTNREDRRALARWLNTATGRGNIPPNTLLAHSNSLFFSPRFLASRLEVLSGKALFDATPEVRKQVAMDLVSFFGMGATAVGLMAMGAKAMGAPFSLELDPRSSDFAKVKSGDTRWDLWAGFQPFARLIAQFYTNERKTSTGDFQDLNRAVTAGRFAQTKLSPAAGLLVDILRGENFLGEEVDIGTSQGLSKQAAERLAPLFLQDLWEAAQNDRVTGFVKALPAGAGVSVQSYTSTGEIREAKADELYGVTWDQLTATEKRGIEEQYAQEFSDVAREAEEGSARLFIERQDEQVRTSMSDLNIGLQTNSIDTRQFSQLMNEIMHDRAVATQAVRASQGLDDEEEQDLISQFLSLRAVATEFGVTDYARLDMLQEEFKSTKTARERAVLNDFSRFVPPDDVAWWFQARDRIRESGYWAAQQQAFGRHSQAVAAVVPGIETRRELEVALAQETNRVQRLRLSILLKRIDADIERQRTRMRREDPNLDRALAQVYATKPQFSTLLRFPELRD